VAFEELEPGLLRVLRFIQTGKLDACAFADPALVHVRVFVDTLPVQPLRQENTRGGKQKNRESKTMLTSAPELRIPNSFAITGVRYSLKTGLCDKRRA